MQLQQQDNLKHILERLVDYLKSDVPFDLDYLNLELLKLNLSLHDFASQELPLTDAGMMLHAILIIEHRLKEMGLEILQLNILKEAIYKDFL